jgi:hypothetical protein
MLKYMGKGAFIPGIPARDLTDEEVERYSQDYEFAGIRGIEGLIASGLYAPLVAEKKAAKEAAAKTKEA